MANIIKTVSSAFAKTRDARIDYHIVEKGSASLLTGIYDQTDPITEGFYRKPDVTNNGESTKLAVIYGEVMITPYLIDVGVESSINDPSSILRTYRFIMGDGQNAGVPVGPNGTPLQNIYIRYPGSTTQTPVVDSSGRPTLGNVILASALGGLITSAPKIWDLIKGSTPDSSKTKNVDPVTGKPIPGQADKDAAKTAAQIPLDDLKDVDTSGVGQNYVLTYDAKSSTWVAKPINTMLTDSLSATVTGGKGGTGGTGGTGGSGGAGGTGGDCCGECGTELPTPVPCEPVSSFVEYPCDAPPMVTRDGMVLLPSTMNTPNNEYTQSINVLGTKGLELHFFVGGNGKKAIWSENDVTECPDTCLVDPNKEGVEKPASGQITYTEPGHFDIQICITTSVCGVEYLIYKHTFSETALSKTSYTFTAPTILWENTTIANLLAKYKGQVWNAANPNVKLYLSRVDVCGSDYDLQFEGYKRLLTDPYKNVQKAPATVQGTNTPQPAVTAVKDDDGKFPDIKPSGGGLGVPSCPADIIDPCPTGEPGSPGNAGTSGSPGTAGQDGTTGTVVIDPPPALPEIMLDEPCARQYGTQTTPPAYDRVQLPTAFLNSGIADDTVELSYEIIVGKGTFELTGAIPGSVTSVIDGSQMQLIGPQADVMGASDFVAIVPDSSSKGEIHYTAVITNSEGNSAGTSCMLIPSDLVVKDSQGASGKVCIDPSTTGGTGKVKITFNGSTRDLTDGFVPYATSVPATAQAIADNINMNVTYQHALDPTSDAWLPMYEATADGNNVLLKAPDEAGDEFNGATMSTETTGGFLFGDCPSTLLGGITANLPDWLKKIMDVASGSNWSKILDILYGIAGNVLGAVILNILFDDAGQEQISLPVDQDVDVTFLYHGRVIKVPAEYDAVNRTGHPSSYDTWGGSWKLSWTQNPAWILYDFIINKKYGLGNDLAMSSAQEQVLLHDIFSIGKYCDDQMTIEGGTEPRFSTNTVITEGTKFQILQQLASVFAGAVLFHNGGLRVVADRADSTVKFLVNQANAGNFEKTLSSSKNFVNKVRLTYVEPDNFYTESVVVAENNEAIMQYGEHISDLVAFGCTSETQAIRYATWVLNSEQDNSVNISYTGGFDHYAIIPGDIVEFYDSNERGIRRAGRIVSQTGVYVILDAPIVSTIGDYFSLTLANGTVHQTTIAAISGVNVTLTAAPPTAADVNATFIAASSSLGRRLYKVIKIDEASNSKFNMTLQLYSTDKY